MSYSNNEKNKECYKKYYAKNKIKFQIKQKQLRERIKSLIRETKSNSNGCSCGEKHFACLDFHHINQKEKLFEISSASRLGYGLEKIKEEIKKCIIICKNCHAKLHWKE